MFRATVLVVLLGAMRPCGAQSFQQEYGTQKYEAAVAVLPDATGITTVVEHYVDENSPHSIQLLRTNLSGGSPAWHSVAIDGACFAQNAIAVGDGTYIICGSRIAPGRYDEDALLAKVAADGTVLWQYTTGTPYTEEELLDVERMPTGGYVCAGVWKGDADSDALLLRMDDNGNVLLQQHYGTDQFERANAVAWNGTDLFFLVGSVLTAGGHTDAYILRVDTVGNEIGWGTYGGARDDQALGIIRTSANALVWAGYTESFGDTTHAGARHRNICTVSMDGNGDTLWTRVLGDTLIDRAAYGLCEATNGDLLLCGERGSIARSDALVRRVTSTGTPIWEQAYGAMRTDRLRAVQPATDGGFFATGTSSGVQSGQVMLMRKSALGQ